MLIIEGLYPENIQSAAQKSKNGTRNDEKLDLVAQKSKNGTDDNKKRASHPGVKFSARDNGSIELLT
jgi:hypothetical protein